jgi:hypothetical protein
MTSKIMFEILTLEVKWIQRHQKGGGGGAKASEKQKQMLLEGMKLRPELLSGKFSNAFTHQTAMDQWKEIANILNSIPGASKDWKGWRKVGTLLNGK